MRLFAAVLWGVLVAVIVVALGLGAFTLVEVHRGERLNRAYEAANVQIAAVEVELAAAACHANPACHFKYMPLDVTAQTTDVVVHTAKTKFRITVSPTGIKDAG